MSFAKNLRARRERRKLTRLQLANEIDVDPQTIYRWEAGTRSPSEEAKGILAGVLHCTIADFYQDD